MDAETSGNLISPLTQRCLDLLSMHSVASLEWCENQKARLNIWAASLGVNAKQRLSIEHRLRNNPDVHSLISRLLLAIEASLLHLNEPSETSVETGQFVDDSDESGANSCTEAVENIEDDIGRLFRLSIQIRNVRTRKWDADNRRHDREDLQSFMAHFRYALDHVHQCHGLLDTQSDHSRPRFDIHEGLKSRLMLVVERRWCRLKDLEYYSNQLTGTTLGNKSLELGAVTQQNPGEIARRETSSRDDSTSKSAQDIPKQSIQASTLPSNFAPALADTKEIVSGAGTSATKFPSSKLSFPRFPDTKGLNEFECQYCRQIKLARQLKKKANWETHVMHDLEPYFCIYEHCDEGEVTFASSEEWTNHMNSKHAVAVWKCSRCLQEFGQEAKFIQHVKTEHSQGLSQNELSLIARSSSVYTTIVRRMFCGYVPEDGVGPHDTQNIITEHIVTDHLKPIALMSIPWDFGDDRSDAATRVSTNSSESEVFDEDPQNRELAAYEAIAVVGDSPGLTESALSGLGSIRINSYDRCMALIGGLEQADEYDYRAEDDISITDSNQDNSISTSSRRRPVDDEAFATTFKSRSPEFFKQGRVFAMMPMVSRTRSNSIESVVSHMDFPHSENGNEIIRAPVSRYVVLDENAAGPDDDSVCLALPISSYNGLGAGKPGIIKDDHGIIYTGKSVPNIHRFEEALRGEQGMLKNALRVVTRYPTEKLDPMARINYATPARIPKSTKVHVIGELHEKSMAWLRNQFEQVRRRRLEQASNRMVSASANAGADAARAADEFDRSNEDEDEDEYDSDQRSQQLADEAQKELQNDRDATMVLTSVAHEPTSSWASDYPTSTSVRGSAVPDPRFPKWSATEQNWYRIDSRGHRQYKPRVGSVSEHSMGAPPDMRFPYWSKTEQNWYQIDSNNQRRYMSVNDVGISGSSLHSTPFQVRSKAFYQRGRVFATARLPSQNSGSRMFVVIQEDVQGDSNYCYVLPISTYGRSGVAKDGIIKADHGIIYSGRKKPEPEPEPQEKPGRTEKGMCATALRVEMKLISEKLDTMSRIHYRAQTFDKREAVHYLGDVAADSMAWLVGNFQVVQRQTQRSTGPIQDEHEEDSNEEDDDDDEDDSKVPSLAQLEVEARSAKDAYSRMMNQGYTSEEAIISLAQMLQTRYPNIKSRQEAVAAAKGRLRYPPNAISGI